MRLFFLLAGFIGANALANQIDYAHYDDLYNRDRIQLSGADDHLCWLDADGVKCLADGDKTPTAYSQFEDPYRLTAAKGVQCVEDRNGIHCWQWGKQELFNYPKLDGKFTLSETHYCYQEKDGYQCPAHAWEKDLDALLLPTAYLNPKEADGPPMPIPGGACSPQIEGDGGLKCWTETFHSSRKIFYLESKRIAAWGTYICANKHAIGQDTRGYERPYSEIACADLSSSHECDRQNRHCPDHFFHLYPDIPVTSPRDGAHLDYGDYESSVPLATTRDGYFCALDNTEHGYSKGLGGYLQNFFEIRCARIPAPDKDRPTLVALSKQSFDYPVLMTPFGDRICGFDSNRLRCVKPSGGETETLAGFRDFPAEARFGDPLGKLKDWATQVYAEKRQLLEAAQAIAEDKSSTAPAPLLLDNALLPLVDSFRSEHFNDVATRYRRLLAAENRARHITSLADFAPDANNRKAAVKLLLATVPVLIQAEGDLDRKDKMQKLVGVFNGTSGVDRQVAIAEALPAIGAQADSERLGGLARTAMALAGFLKREK